MKLVLISPAGDHSGESTVVQTLFEHGLVRYHLRKPGWNATQMAAWLAAFPAKWRERVWLHAHHALAKDFHVGGIHFRDEGTVSRQDTKQDSRWATSRSCHDIATLQAALDSYDSLFFGPLYPSLSKPDYGPAAPEVANQVGQMLATRGPTARRARVFALGGITAARIEACRALGFDGVAVLGAVWNAADPIAAFLELQHAVRARAAASLQPLESLA